MLLKEHLYFGANDFFFSGLHDEDIHFLVQKFACIANIHCSLNFVSCENPYLDARLPDIIDSLVNILLKFVFNSCGAKQFKSNFKLLRYTVNLFFFICGGGSL